MSEERLKYLEEQLAEYQKGYQQMIDQARNCAVIIRYLTQQIEKLKKPAEEKAATKGG